MKHEDDLAQRDAEAYHQLIHGNRAGKPLNQSQSDADEMGDNIFLGDYAVTQHLPQPQPRKSSGVGKVLLGAGLLATGAGIGVALPLLLDAVKRDPAPVVVPPTVENKTESTTQIFDYEVGEPFFGKP